MCVIKVTKAVEKMSWLPFLWFYFFLPPLGGGGRGAISRMTTESPEAERFIAPVTSLLW